jgi:glycosyltransferase involved in cell wall biosynthesis
MVESRVAGRNLTNVTVRDPVPREQLGTLLGSASLCVIALVPGMYGISVPSRTYNIMAAGRPILAIVDRDSEVWRLVEEEKIGWTVDASASPEEIARVIRQAAADPEAARAAGERARTVAGERYSESAVLAQFVDLLRAQA